MWRSARNTAHRTRRAGLATAAALLSALALAGGCVFRYPTDLEARVTGVVGPAGIREIVREDVAFYAPRHQALVVELSSRSDWVRRVDSLGAMVWLNAGFCGSRRLVYLATPWLFANGLPVVWANDNLPHPAEDGTYVVTGFLYVRDDRGDMKLLESHKQDPGQDYYDTYDLEGEARDVCLYVNGTTMQPGVPPLGYTYRSNVVVVGKEEIAAALRGAGRD